MPLSSTRGPPVSGPGYRPSGDRAGLQASLGHNAVTLLDVRNQNEWDSGRIAGARHITLGYLPDH